jgi:hypothetical protein
LIGYPILINIYSPVYFSPQSKSENNHFHLFHE